MAIQLDIVSEGRSTAMPPHHHHHHHHPSPVYTYSHTSGLRLHLCECEMPGHLAGHGHKGQRRLNPPGHRRGSQAPRQEGQIGAGAQVKAPRVQHLPCHKRVSFPLSNAQVSHPFSEASDSTPSDQLPAVGNETFLWDSSPPFSLKWYNFYNYRRRQSMGLSPRGYTACAQGCSVWGRAQNPSSRRGEAGEGWESGRAGPNTAAPSGAAGPPVTHGVS
jgi:hypothetical protein